eukprot:CAMPEP_0172552908 /NCGR_PEP_ID=MMETSP1067-20121228/47267_1 /TAXON_ID=265564 ORGANISM="Thalassiosira punctigera, Strain Tpunct2005C2" /NCGR_SAMPLE_ID=MMETSP1067 /ASSEMBLY_ACC=CAM_ASM_000444 /LENGTH=98 /DNA_ID=CAMNT_0013340983 /DNA_START=271 /DNA_END=567 /DNA_ORIENTATION=-
MKDTRGSFKETKGFDRSAEMRSQIVKNILMHQPRHSDKQHKDTRSKIVEPPTITRVRNPWERIAQESPRHSIVIKNQPLSSRKNTFLKPQFPPIYQPK